MSPTASEHSPDGEEPPAKPGPRRSEHDGHIGVELLLNTSDVDPPATGWLDDQFTRIARLAGVEGGGAVNLVLVDDAEMSRLHEQYQRIAGTTDVLTFDLREADDTDTGDPAGVPLEADIVLCVDEARRQAARRGHDARLELLLYAVHGLLHLLGYDDHDPDEAAAMHRREDQLLEAAGLGRVYDAQRSRRQLSGGGAAK